MELQLTDWHNVLWTVKTFTSSDFTLFVLVILHLSHYPHRPPPLQPPVHFHPSLSLGGDLLFSNAGPLVSWFGQWQMWWREGDTGWGKRESSSHSLLAWDLRLPVAVSPLRQLWAGSHLSGLVLNKPSGRGRSRYSFQFLLIPGQPQHLLLVPLNLPTLL